MKSPLVRWYVFLAAFVPAVGSTAADTIGGRYVGVDEPAFILTLQESSDGKITGSLAGDGTSMSINARRQGARFTGTIGPAGESFPLTLTPEGDRVVLLIGPPEDAERMAFRRADAPPAGGGKRNVVINGRRFTDAEVAQAEKIHRVRIPDANYWYDRVLGAWGARGGPTAGFIAPGLDLGGPLAADASGGGTNVFVNGRALHPYDLLALQSITGPITPGRYFITAQGLAGFEGGPSQWNLAALVAQARSGGGGGNTWQSGLSSGFSDGTTGAVFLPNGGIVSTGG